MTTADHVEEAFDRKKVGVVVIGRNEGDRLKKCLHSLVGQVGSIVYVDSGSTDGSLEFAQQLGVQVVNLDVSSPFTAARARNAGIEHLVAESEDIDYVQFVDGDCEVEQGWISRASSVLDAEASVVAVCGRRRERFPEASKYNLICQLEWNRAFSGRVKSFGGDVMTRTAALRRCKGYNENIIAAEDDELSIRLRRDGGEILQLNDPMTIHDADMHTVQQWFRRAQRCGHGYANLYAMYGAPPECYFQRQFFSALIWGGLIPIFALVLLFIEPASLILAVAIYALQVWRIYRGFRRDGLSRKEAGIWGGSCVLSKIPECVGICSYLWRRWRNSAPQLIEYK